MYKNQKNLSKKMQAIMSACCILSISDSGSLSDFTQKASPSVQKLWLTSCSFDLGVFHSTEGDCAFPLKHPHRGQRPTHCWSGWASWLSALKGFKSSQPHCKFSLPFQKHTHAQISTHSVSQGYTAECPGLHHTTPQMEDWELCVIDSHF